MATRGKQNRQREQEKSDAQAAPAPAAAGAGGRRIVTTRDEIPLPASALNPPPSDAPASSSEYIPDDEPLPSDIALTDLLSHFIEEEEEATVHIYRQGNSVHDMTLLGAMAAAEFDPIMLAHPPYNGGRFRIHARSRRQDGAGTAVRINRVLQVAPAVSASPSSGAPDFAAIMREGLQALQGQIAQLVAQQAQPRDPLQTLEGIERLARAIMPARGGGAEELLTTVTLLERLQALRGGNPSDRIPIDDDGKLSTGGLMREALGLILEATRAQHQQTLAPPPGALPAPPAQPAPTGQSAPPAPGAQTESASTLTVPADERQEVTMLLKLQLRMANRAAAKGAAPEEYAERVYPLLEPEMLRLLANNADWFNFLCGVEPLCRPWQAWFVSLRGTLLSIATEDGILTPAPDSGRVAPDKGSDPGAAQQPVGGKPH